MAKAAVRSFARTLGGELAPNRIRVNAVSPGPIDRLIFGKGERIAPEPDAAVQP